ncbi:MAG: hypothetical protein QOH86_1089 [Sphingomonadales bacterium]|jgi:hypothetical protein|nr:hypothetical protein [Sphingomonadales bacterium]
MIPALRYLQGLLLPRPRHPVHQPVLVVDPARPPAGKVAVFEDLYGNLWDLIQFADSR